jgi:membrane protease YdiL (CAAX protease family)
VTSGRPADAGKKLPLRGGRFEGSPLVLTSLTWGHAFAAKATVPEQARMNPDLLGEAPPGRRVKSIELGVFLFLILAWLGPSSFLFRIQVHLRFWTVAVSTILGDLALCALVIFFLWRNGEPLRQIGWIRRQWGIEVFWGIVLFLPAISLISALERALQGAGFSAPTKLPAFLSPSRSGVGLALVLVIVVAVVEETIFRGYLISRLRTATGRTAAAVLLSSVLFSLGHGYEGTAGMVSVFVLGVILALVYLWRASLVAPVIMHFLTDFTSIVLVALSKGK